MRRRRFRFSCFIAELGAVSVSVLAVGMMTAPSALAYWNPPNTGACAGVAPPQGQTGGDYWVNGENGTCDEGDWISQDEFNSLVNQEVAAGDEATGVTVPADISSADATAGTGYWDSLASATSPLKGEAMDALTTVGDWAEFSSLGTYVALGVGAFDVGWQIGSAIDSLLGIDQESAGYGGSGSLVESPSGLQAVNAGEDLCGPGGCSAGPPGGCGGCNYVTVYNPPAPTDGFVVDWQFTGSGFNTQWEAENAPVGTEFFVISDNSNGTNNMVGFVPATVVALPGPNQGAPSSYGQKVSGSNTAPSEAQQKQNAATVLQSPTYDQFNQSLCAHDGPAGPCPFWVMLPSPSPGETWTAYQAALANAGFTNVQRVTLSSDTVDLDQVASAVTAVSPTPGTAIDTAQPVTVTTNPDTMPQPTQREIDLANILETQSPGITDSNKLDVARSCLELEDAATGNTDTSGDSGDISFTNCSSLPIFISGYDVREAAEHDLEALGWVSSPNNNGQNVNPAWLQLNRDIANKPGDGWYRGVAPCSSPTPPGENCDEYPFYSTTQGGQGANLKYIDATQNQLQGTRLYQFYSSVASAAGVGIPGCNVPTGQEFLAVPLPPDFENENTTWACNAGKW
jgi:hypothetical protein